MRLQVKKRTIVYLAAAILLLLTLGIGIAIVYSDYIYAPNKGFYYMKISSTDRDIRASAMGEMLDEETYERMEERIAALSEELDHWAEANRASLFLRSVIPFYPHLSVALYSDIDEELKIQKISDEDTGLYVEKQMYEDPYMTQDGVFLPEQAAQKIGYVYDREGLPKGLQRRGYYFLTLKQYKLPADSLYSSQLFTDAEDITGLLEILKKYQIGYSDVQANSGKPFSRLKRLVSPMNFYNLVLILTLSAAIGGFVFLTFMRFRNAENERIRHLNGKPLYRSAAEILLLGLGLFIISYGIMYLAVPKYCSYMTDNDIVRIQGSVGSILLIVTLISYGLASLWLVYRLRRR